MSILDILVWVCKLAFFIVMEIAVVTTVGGISLVIFFGIVDFFARRRRPQA